MKKLLTLFLFVCMSVSLYAQDIQVTGKVTQASDGAALPGVTVLVKGTSNATSTDNSGNYAITCAKEATLVFSFVGFTTKEMAVAGLTVVNVSLAEDKLNLNEVVVTALNVKREKKSLGYAVQEVKSEDINRANNFNPIGALSGKVAGAQITQASGDPGAATYILLRGQTTIGLENQPLIVVDGVPMNNNNTSVGNPDNGTNNELEETGTSNRGLDINPNDIENVSVLKGPAAAALYGNQAASGAIIITTKKAKMVKGDGPTMHVTFQSNISWDRVNKLPELQNKYSQGTGGQYAGPSSGTRTSWGALIDTLFWNGDNTYKWDVNGDIVGKSDPTHKTAVTPYENAKNFFQTGMTYNNSLSVDGGTDRSSYRFSVSNIKQTGIIPLQGLNKTNLSLNTDFNLSSKLTAGATVNYANINNDRTQMGSNTSGLMLGLLRTPITFDNSNGLADPVNDPLSYSFADGKQRTYRGGSGYDNPYWTINKNRYNSVTNHVFGNFHFNYKPTSWLDITDRIGTDMYNTLSHQHVAKGSAVYKPGKLYTSNEGNNLINNDLILTASKKLNANMDLSGLVGWNMYSEKNTYNYTEGDNLTISDFYHISNAQSVLARETNSLYRKNSLYAQAKFAYKSYLYVDVTGRYEQSSAFLPNSVGNFFYPSISAAYIFTDHIKWFKESQKILSFGKIRLSYASVGKDPSVYSTQTYYGSTNVNDGWTPGEPFPFGGITGFQHGGINGTIADPNLKPERTNSREFGLDLRFLNGRINVDYTYYKSNSKDLLLSVPVARSSGYAYKYTNAASLWSEGHELSLTFVPVKTKNFTWESTINWAKNVTVCSDLAQGIEKVTLNGFEGSLVVVARGERFGMFEGGKFLRDENGKVLIDDNPASPTYGYPVEDGKVSTIASLAPKWTGGWLNNFNYKGLNLSILLDTKQGNKIWNGTRGAITYFGTAKATETRGESTVFNTGIYEGSLMGHMGADGKIYHYDANGNEVAGSGAANTQSVKLDEAWYSGNGGGFGAVAEHFVDDASYIKLKELALNYDLAPCIYSKCKFVKGASVGVFGRNLWIKTKYNGVDPETSLTGATDAQGIDYFNNPGTKTFGINLRINF